MKCKFTSWRKYKISLILLIVTLLLSMGTVLTASADAVTGYYPKINLKVGKYSQIKSGCGVCSMAMIEGTFFESNFSKVYTNKKRSAVYNKTIAYNKNNKTYAYWNGYKNNYAKTEANYLKALYNQLASGYPVIVYRNSPHYAVVYAYTGSSSKLELSGFQVMNDTTSGCTSMSLKKWIGKCGTNKYRYITRRAGITGDTLVKKITFAVNHPAAFHKKGSSNAVLGRVVSNKTLKTVKVGIYNASNGKKVYEKSFKPNSKNFDVNKADSAMKFAKLAKGSYVYKIYATDAGGRKSTYSFKFKVVSNAAQALISGVGNIISSGSSSSGSTNTGSTNTGSTNTGSSNTGSNTTTNTEVASTLSLTNADYAKVPSVLCKGSACTLSGQIVSNYNISSVYVAVQDSAGNVKFSAQATPNSKSYSLYLLDSKMSFSKLAAGKYTLTVSARDAKISKILVQQSFTVSAATISGSSMTYPVSIVSGNTFAVIGTVSASNKIKNVVLSVYTTAGVKKFSASAAPGTASYNVYNLDSKMTFRKLTKGSYIYRVAVTDTKGITKYVITKSFTVK